MKKFAYDNNLTGEIYSIENDENIALANIISEHINIKDTSYFEGCNIDNKKYGISEMNFNTPYGAVPVTYKSFFQANRYLLDKFQHYAVSLVQDHMNIVELYAGAGFFTCGLMQKGNVEACESEQISSNLGRQLGYNLKTLDSGKFLQSIKKCDTIFLDPPRDGADKVVIENIKRLKPYDREIDNNPFIVFQMHGIDLLEELKKRGIFLEEKLHEGTVSLIQDVVRYKSNKEICYDVPEFYRIDFSKLEDCSEALFKLLPANPPFSERGDFKERYVAELRRAQKGVQRFFSGKLNAGQMFPEIYVSFGTGNTITTEHEFSCVFLNALCPDLANMSDMFDARLCFCKIMC